METNVLKQIIWSNRNIHVDGKPIFIGSWFQTGINPIRELLDENLTGNFLSLCSFERKFNFQPPFTMFYGLISVIPFQ